MRLATMVAVGCALTLICAKTWAYLNTHSVALLSSLADSALDLLASAVNLVAVRFALTPADDRHRFGHGKAEPLSGLAQSAFVAGSAVLIVIEAVSRFREPTTLTNAPLGIGVTIFSLVVTLGLVSFQRFVVKRTQSVAISADSLHYTGDLLLNVSVIFAIYLSSSFGLTWADPVFGIAISFFIMFNAARIAIASVHALMDRELPDQERKRIVDVALTHPMVKQVHDLRTRTSGLQKFIQMHIVVDGSMSLTAAHGVCAQVHRAIEDAFPGADIIIHEDPDTVVDHSAVVEG